MIGLFVYKSKQKASLHISPDGQYHSEQHAGIDAEVQIIPMVLPGDQIERFTSAYGTPIIESGNTYTWHMKGMSVNAYKKQDGFVASVDIDVDKGMTVRTPDGIFLGKDTFHDVIEWARRNQLQIHERIENGDGIWLLKVYFISKVRPENVSIYLWTLPGSDLVDSEIDRGTLPLHSDKFLNMIVRSYTAEAKTIPQYEQIEGGSPSVHN
jgi:hypothetical protein